LNLIVLEHQVFKVMILGFGFLLILFLALLAWQLKQLDFISELCYLQFVAPADLFFFELNIFIHPQLVLELRRQVLLRICQSTSLTESTCWSICSV